MDSSYQPQPGDIGIVRMTGVGGALIRVGQWLNGDGFADFEHAFVVVSSTEIVEAMPGGALLSPLAHYDDVHPVFLHCPDANREAVARAAQSLIGTPYSIADYFALAAHRFHIPAPHLRTYIETSGHMICSQLADRAAAMGGWHLFSDGRWPGYVTPGDLYGLYDVQESKAGS